MNNKEQNYIIETLLKAYPNSSLINEEYIINLLERIDENDPSKIIFTCKNIINNYLVEQAKNDENVLLELAFDMNSVKERICRKLKLDANNPIYDDYLIEGILNYDGIKSLDLYLSSFIMQKIKTKYIPLKSNKILEYKNGKISKEKELICGSKPKTSEVSPVITLKEKDPIKEENLKVEPLAREQEQEVTLEEENKIEEVVKEETVSTSLLIVKCGSEPLTKKQLKNQRRREAKKEQLQTKNEDIAFEVPKEDLEDLLVLDNDEMETIEDVTKDLCEPLEQHEEINGKELASRISEIVNNIPPMEEDDIVTKLYKLLDIKKKINTEDNIFYYYYTCLRFGTKEKTYPLEIIASTLGLSLDDVIAFEEYTVNQIKELLNTADKNISLTFN